VECSRSCLGNGQCQAFTFNVATTKRDQPNCFTKASLGELRANSSALSGVLLGPDEDPPEFAFSGIDPNEDLSFGVNFPLFTIANDPVASAADSLDDCIAVCLSDDRCRGFSYRSKTKQCLMKSLLGTSVSESGYTSGVKRTISASPIEILSLTN
jgi:hypothetical protein